VFKLGLIINPFAGVGGSVGLKGSDGNTTVEKALALGAKPKAALRAEQALAVLIPVKQSITVFTYPKNMGEDLAKQCGFNVNVLGRLAAEQTTADDTERAVKDLEAAGVDLILFVGGDGTARNVCNTVSSSQ